VLTVHTTTTEQAGPTLTGHSEQLLEFGCGGIYQSTRDVFCSSNPPCLPRTRGRLLTGMLAAPAQKAAEELAETPWRQRYYLWNPECTVLVRNGIPWLLVKGKDSWSAHCPNADGLVSPCCNQLNLNNLHCVACTKLTPGTPSHLLSLATFW
jgi:hypothetical protein